MPGSSVFKWWENGAVPDSVPVKLTFSRKSGVELRRYFHTSQNPDRRRQNSVQGGLQSLGVETIGGEVEMRALTDGMDACVRSSGTVHATTFPRHPLYRRL